MLADAYSPKDVVFRWNGGSPVVISKDVTLSQYEFVDILSDDLTVQLPNGGMCRIRTNPT